METKKIETIAERLVRFRRGEILLESIKGRIVDKKTAKRLYTLTTLGWSIQEERLSDNMSLVVMVRIIDSFLGDDENYEIPPYNFDRPVVFLIRGRIWEKLNMC